MKHILSGIFAFSVGALASIALAARSHGGRISHSAIG
jgi:hypothetical protein